MHSPSTSFLFGEVEIQPDQNTVIKEGVGHQLPPRAMDVLIYLIKHNDRVVSGGELLDTFWVGRVVEESTIHRQISRIRTAVGDSAREAKYIKTVSKRGYQAVAPVIKQAAAPLEKDAEIIAVKENEFAGEDKETLVCVSYAYQDAAVVREAIKPLERQGVKVWHKKGEPTEANIPSVIDLSLSGSSALLFFVSRRSIVSERCNQEIRLAKNENVAIIPVYLEDVELTSELKEELARQQALGRKEQALRTQLLHILSGSQIGNVSTPKSTPEKSVNPRWLNTSVGLALLVLAGFLSIQMLFNKSALSGLLNQNREPRETIAVLPFNSLSGRDSVGFFAEGLSHSILTDLVDIGHMIVAPQTAVLQLYQQDLELAELASTLEVDYVLMGSVQEIEGELRITAQLIRAVDGYHVLSKIYQRPLDESFKSQSAISRNISRMSHDKIWLDLRRQHPDRFREFNNVHPLAVFLYLKATEISNEYVLGEGGDPVVAMQIMRKAVAVDPNFLLAHSELAWSYLRRIDGGLSLKESSKLAHAAIDRIFTLDPDSAEAIFYLTQAYIQLDLNYAKAEELIEAQISRVPEAHWWRTLLAEIAFREGRAESGMALIQTDATLQPDSNQAEFLPIYAGILLEAGRYHESLKHSNRALELLHRGSQRAVVLLMKVDALLHLGRSEEALTLLEEAGHTAGGQFAERFVAPFIRTGQLEQAKEALRASVVTPTNRYLIAAGYDSFGDIESVFDLIHDGIMDNDRSILAVMRGNSFSEVVLNDPRFQEMITLLETREQPTSTFQQSREMYGESVH